MNHQDEAITKIQLKIDKSGELSQSSFQSPKITDSQSIVLS